jgi:hypothetical protein
MEKKKALGWPEKKMHGRLGVNPSRNQLVAELEPKFRCGGIKRDYTK